MIPELKVPFLHEKQVERAANELLHKYAKDKGKPVRAPIDVENILEGYFKLDLVYIDLPDFIGVPDVLGATFIKDQRVFIDESLMIEGKEGRLAFTLAHEGGHWYLHRPLIEMEQVTATLFGKDDVPKQPTIFCRSSQKKAPAEWQADRFAAALLMPAADVRATVRALCGDTLPTWEDVEAKRKARALDEKLRDLATEVMTKGNFTNVSNEAIRAAAHRFMEDFGGLGLMHRLRVNGQVKVLESYLAPTDFTIGELAVRKGTWLLAVRVLSDELWERVKSGDLTGFSIGGSARRVPEPAPVPTSEQPTNNQPASEAAA